MRFSAFVSPAIVSEPSLFSFRVCVIVLSPCNKAYKMTGVGGRFWGLFLIKCPVSDPPLYKKSYEIVQKSYKMRSGNYHFIRVPILGKNGILTKCQSLTFIVNQIDWKVNTNTSKWEHVFLENHFSAYKTGGWPPAFYKWELATIL